MNFSWPFGTDSSNGESASNEAATPQVTAFGTNVANVFSLNIDTASFDNFPPGGEIEVSTANPFASLQDQDTPAHAEQISGEDYEALQRFLASIGVNPGFDEDPGDFSSLTSGILAPASKNLFNADNVVDPHKLLDQQLAQLSAVVQQSEGLQYPQTVEGGAASFDALNLDSYAPPAFSLNELSPPETDTSSTISPVSYGSYGEAVHPTNLNASGSGTNKGEVASTPQASPPMGAGLQAPSQQQQDQAQRQTRPAPTHSHSAPAYVPPKGAANATRRRAAASWKPPASVLGDSNMS